MWLVACGEAHHDLTPALKFAALLRTSVLASNPSSSKVIHCNDAGVHLTTDPTRGQSF